MQWPIRRLSRPVVTMDKLEIIDIAQEIDTFEISIQPSKIVVPSLHRIVQRPIQNSKMRSIWATYGCGALVERAVAGIIVTEITPKAEKDEVDDLIEDLL